MPPRGCRPGTGVSSLPLRWSAKEHWLERRRMGIGVRGRSSTLSPGRRSHSRSWYTALFVRAYQRLGAGRLSAKPFIAERMGQPLARPARALPRPARARRSISAGAQHRSRALAEAFARIQAWAATPWIVAAFVGSVTFGMQGYRVSLAPDIFSDENLYLTVARNIALGQGMVADRTMFWYHPPLFLLIEALFLKLSGLDTVGIVDGVLASRILNVFFAGLTAAALLLFGRKLHSYKAGLLIAALYLLDPYVERINRRDMLETLAMLW